MASGTGFICVWIVGDVGGIIHVCGGDDLVGDDVAFAFKDCSAELQKILVKKNVGAQPACPPSSNALSVEFDFDLVNGMELAVNVR